MPIWKCAKCGYEKDARCRPGKCPECGAPRDKFTKA